MRSLSAQADKKARYDQFGFAGVDPNYGAGAGGGGGFGGFTDFDFGDLGDIFGSFFGGGFGGNSRSSRSGPQRGESIGWGSRYPLRRRPSAAEKEVTVDRVDQCPTCKGSGCEPGTTPEVCTQCGGKRSGAAAAADAHGRFCHHNHLPKVRWTW